MLTYHRPATLQEALAIRAGGDVMVLAGGTDVYPAKAARSAWGDMHHKDVLDITRLAELRGIADAGSHWRIGALATWSELIAAELPALFDGLKLAAREVGGAQIQNRGTIAGNLCTASPAGDGLPNLLALDAEIQLASAAGTRRVPMREFLTGYRQTACRADEIVTAILMPKRVSGNVRSHFVKLGARRYLVISIAMVAGIVEIGADGRISAARLAVGACSAVPQRLPALEAKLVGAPLAAASGRVASEHVAHLTPIDDIRASAEYRRHAALTLVRDLLAQIAATPEQRAA
jgi:xanthine dehydrogenase small subunit